MKPFRDWTIGTRLSLAMMATSLAAVLLVGAFLTAFSVYRTRREHVRNLHAIAHLVGRNAQASLIFDMPADAEQLLASLAVNESIALACIYDENGTPFAVYRRTQAAGDPPSIRPESYAFEGRYLNVFHEIDVDGHPIGTLFIQDDRAVERAILKRDVQVWVLGMLLALAAAFAVARHFRRIIAEPILSLARVAQRVGAERDFGLRAPKRGDDEVGRLADSFNDMLSHIRASEQALSESEQCYRELVENIDLGITLVDPQHNVVTVNAALARMFHVEREALIGCKCYEKFEKRAGICAHCPGEKALREHKPADVETYGVRDDGSRFPVHIRAFPLFDDSGRPTGFVELVEDLTERKKAEKVLRQTEERFRDFFHQAPIGFHIFGPDQRFIDINEAELDMIGYSRDEVIGQKTWADLTVPEQKAEAVRHWDEIVRTGYIRNVEYTLLHKDGHPVQVIVNASALFDEDDRLIRTRGSVIDITERRQMLARLRESESMLKNVLDTINVRVFWKDNDLRFRGCNQLFAMDAGVSSPEEIVGKTDFDLPWKAQAPVYRRDDRQVIESGEPKLNYEEPQTTPEGKSIWLKTSKIPLRDANGRVVGMLGTYEDITERKRAELAVRLSEQRFRAIADYTYDWELWISPQGHVLWTNPAIERITGYTVDEFMELGKYPEAIVLEDDRQLVSQAFESALEGGSGRQLEFRICRKDGRTLWVSMSWQPIFDNKGVPQGHRESIEDISEKKKAEVELEESRERFRSLVESTSDWIWEIDTENRYTYVSPKIHDLLGYEPHEVLAKTPFDLMSSAEADRVKPIFEEIWQLCKPFKALENAAVHKKGHEVILESSGVPIFDAYGSFAGYRGIDRDITQRKRAADRLRETTQMLKLILDSIPSRVFWKDRNSIYLGCNRLFALDSGMKDPQDVVGKTDDDLAWAQWADAHRQIDRKVIGTDQAEYHIIERRLNADGRVAWVEINKVPLHDLNGNTVGVLGSYEDITQRKLFEDAISAIVEGTARTTGEDFLRSLVRHLAAAISVRFVFLGELVEPRMDRVRTLVVWAGDHYGENFEHDLEGSPCQIVTSGQMWVHETGVKELFPDSQPLGEMDAQGYLGLPLFDSAQRPLGLLAAVHDKPLEQVEFAQSVMSVFATRAAAELERKQAEEEREQLLRILEQKNRELESIVYTSSHDLRSTVVNVQGFSAELSSTCTHLLEVLEDIPVPHEKLREELLTILHEDIPTQLKFITASAARMDMLIAGLLKLSRLGRIRLNLQPVDMDRLIRRIVHAMQHQLQEANAEVHVDPLPPCKGDPEQLAKVFGNLIDNAVKYRHPERTPVVSVSGHIEDQMSVYCIADNGPGIAPRHQKNVFEVFHRLDPEGPIEGEGLGLSIVRRIVDRHGGRISLDSTPGEGSRFYVALPTA
ncbi:MAG TPA: PAS domain S-box protein [Anaerohalosphaeraceae bacterium]|jgi:PAS domain S-box-containing protein|nr:PAS domain S-box protein [Anaerohalosphaeraceae bacterium]HRT51582.1 PAS domain S-box protein [Anaerohalosphaeraceae bacterium]HRT87583.1 PAS domain S-box protein [Anaerohalosphaeraceae bacterium]